MPRRLTRLIVLILFLPITISGYLPEKGGKNDSSSTYNTNLSGFSAQIFSMIRSEVSKPDYEVFKKALTGFLNLKGDNNIKKNILTIIDFSLSSRLDRMWIIDMNKMKVVHTSLVAHGRNSGEEFPSHFSNSPASLQSSLGFYITGGTYMGKHGISLLLDGVEPGINDNARERAIVIHGADYVSRAFILSNGRLGRSFGCPSIPLEDHEKIIKLLSGGTCIYIHYPDDKYQAMSRFYADGTTVKGMYSMLSEWTGFFYNVHSFPHNK